MNKRQKKKIARKFFRKKGLRRCKKVALTMKREDLILPTIPNRPFLALRTEPRFIEPDREKVVESGKETINRI